MRGLCNGLGPAMFGVIFYLFNVDLNDESMRTTNLETGLLANGSESAQHVYNNNNHNELILHNNNNFLTQMIPGPPFFFGALMVICAIMVAIFMKEEPMTISLVKRSSTTGEHKSRYQLFYYFYVF